MKNKSKPNIKVIIYSIIALICLVLSFIIDWLFIIPAVIIVILNQRELMTPKDKDKKVEKKIKKQKNKKK
jgi:hypothetical protein